ncbi:MAG TPA: ABC transporter ATP-binding protein, partial [Pirellulales bacterium]
VFALVKPYRGAAALMCGLSILAVAVELVPPMLQKILVDDILKVDPKRVQLNDLLILLAWIVLGLGAVRLVAALIAVWKGRVSSKVGAALTSDLRTAMVQKLQEQSIAYHDRNQVGMLMSRVAYDTETMHTLMHQLSSGFLLQILQLVGIGGMLFWLNPKLAFFTLLPMPLVLAGSWFFSKYLFPRHHRYWDSVGRQATALTGMLSGIRVVKAFAQEGREYQRFEDSSERLRDSRVMVDTATTAFSSFMGFLFGLGALIVWYVGGQSVISETMSLGDLMAFLAYLAMFYTPLTTLSESTTWVSSFFASSQRIFELLDAPALVQEPTKPVSLDNFTGRIKFDDVHFAYEENRPVLKGINFEINPGETIGVVGRSGSGKSTLVSLITRFYDVGAGRIQLDGIDVRDVSSQQLRRKIGMVLQEPFLFEGTIGDNITYGNADASWEQIVRAAKAANAHDFVMRSPFAYDTVIGERGAGLSGGERQRLSISRALLYDPQVLILDEATSSVDTESERLIQEAVKRFAKGRTVIAIAHRLSTLKDADRLLCFDQGRLVEQGTPTDLMNRNGLYASLVRIQSSFHKSAVHNPMTTSHEAATAAEEAASEVDETSEEGDANGGEFVWITPDEARWQAGRHGELQLVWKGKLHRGASVLAAFPANSREELLSVRVPCDNDGE